MDKYLDRNSSVRILSITLALILWFLGVNQQNPIVERSIAVPVEYGEVDPGLALISVSPRSIVVTVEGRQGYLEGLSDADFTALVDLEQIPAGVSHRPIAVSLPQSAGINWGFGALRIVDYEPSVVEITVDQIETRQVDVDIRVVGNPHPDYVADTMQLERATVAVTAPASELQTVDRLSGTIDIEGAESTVTVSVPLRAVDFGGRDVRGAQLASPEIEVTVPIRARPPAATVAVNPQIGGTPESGFRVAKVTVDPQLVTLRAPSDQIGEIDSISTRVLNVDGRSSSFTETVSLVTPGAVVWQSHQEVQVTVVIEEDHIERTLRGIALRPQNLPSGYNWSMEPPEVDVRLRGRRDLVERVTEGLLDATFDARGLEEGEHRVTVKVIVPDGLQHEVQPATILLTLEERT